MARHRWKVSTKFRGSRRVPALDGGRRGGLAAVAVVAIRKKPERDRTRSRSQKHFKTYEGGGWRFFCR